MTTSGRYRSAGRSSNIVPPIGEGRSSSLLHDERQIDGLQPATSTSNLLSHLINMVEVRCRCYAPSKWRRGGL